MFGARRTPELESSISKTGTNDGISSVRRNIAFGARLTPELESPIS